MFKYLIFQTVHQNIFSSLWGLIRWKVWIPDLHEAQKSTVIALNYLSPCLMRGITLLSLIRMSQRASNFYDSGVSSQEVWALMIFVPPLPGLFLLLLMFRNCEGSPGSCCCLCHPGRWAEEQPPSLERFWISSEMTGMRFYLISSTQHWLLSVLSPCRPAGEVCNILSESTFNRQIKASRLFLFGMYESFKTWHKHSIEMAKKVWL